MIIRIKANELFWDNVLDWRIEVRDQREADRRADAVRRALDMQDHISMTVEIVDKRH